MGLEPIPGVKARIDARPTDASVQAAMASADLIQRRYERWTRWWYTQILAAAMQELEALDRIPDDADLAIVLARMDRRQERVLDRMLLGVYPMARDLLLDDEQAKSVAVPLGVKAREPEDVDEDSLSETQRRILAWFQANIQASCSLVTSTTRDLVEEARRASDTTAEFLRNLRASGAFDQVRARRIAVTQTGQALNASLQEIGEQVAHGEEMYKQWITFRTTNVRATHRPMDRVAIPQAELYEVPRLDGGTDLMMHPCDSSHGASPANVINCRCKSFPIAARYVARPATLVYKPFARLGAHGWILRPSDTRGQVPRGRRDL